MFKYGVGLSEDDCNVHTQAAISGMQEIGFTTDSKDNMRPPLQVYICSFLMPASPRVKPPMSEKHPSMTNLFRIHEALFYDSFIGTRALI